MTPIEIMALIVAVGVLIKIILMLISPKSWEGSVTKISWANPIVTSILFLIATAVSLVFLFRELTIIQIFGVMFFAMSLMMLSFAPYSKDMLILEDKMFKNLKAGWLAGIVWTVLAIWVLYALFV